MPKSYQRMAAHLAAQAAPGASKENNAYQTLLHLYTSLNRKIELLDPKVPATRTANKLLSALNPLLRLTQELQAGAAQGDAEQTEKLLKASAAACESFDRQLTAFKRDCLSEPEFFTSAKDVQALENAVYDQGRPILAAAGVSDEALMDEDPSKLREGLDEDQKYRIYHRIEVQNQREQKEAEEKRQEEERRYASNLRRRPEQEPPRREQRQEPRPYEPIDYDLAMSARERYPEAKLWTNQERHRSKMAYDPSFLEQPTAELSWKNYRLLHLRRADPEQENYQENLAKALVSTVQTRLPAEQRRPFTVSTARSQAKEIMKLPTFRNFSERPEMVRKYLNGNALDKVCAGIVRPFQVEDTDHGSAILSCLKQMANKMDPPENQPQEWKNLIRTMKKLDPYVDAEEQEQQLKAVYKATTAYMKGRKSVRDTQAEQDQFNQSLDVLSTLSRVSDFSNCAAQTVFERINEVRGRPFHKHEYVHLHNFGPEKLSEHTGEIERKGSLAELDAEAPVLK